MNTNAATIAATIAANKAKMEASIAKMKASFAAIENAKTRAVVLDAPAPKTSASVKKYIKTDAVKTEVSKTDAVKSHAARSPKAGTTELSKQPVATVRPEIIIAKKKVAAKPKGKLSKLVKGKTVFDFSK
jgi:hypothetical protein